jgi:hypothetical protein
MWATKLQYKYKVIDRWSDTGATRESEIGVLIPTKQHSTQILRKKCRDFDENERVGLGESSHN